MVVALKSVLLASCEFEENEVSCNHGLLLWMVPDWTVALCGPVRSRISNRTNMAARYETLSLAP